MDQPCTKARILVVDNDRSSSERVSAVLRQAGYTAVAESRSTEAALRACGKELPRLVIIDPWVGCGTGFEMVEKLGDSSESAEAPRFLFLTADVCEGSQIQAQLLGAAALLEKPFLADELLHQVQAALV